MLMYILRLIILHCNYNLIKKRLTGLTFFLRCAIICRILQRGEAAYEKIIYVAYIAAAVSAAVLFSLAGMTACTSVKDEPIRLADCNSYTIASDTVLRSCEAEDITQIIEIFDGMEYEKTDIPSRLN